MEQQGQQMPPGQFVLQPNQSTNGPVCCILSTHSFGLQNNMSQAILVAVQMVMIY